MNVRRFARWGVTRGHMVLGGATHTGAILDLLRTLVLSGIFDTA